MTTNTLMIPRIRPMIFLWFAQRGRILQWSIQTWIEITLSLDLCSFFPQAASCVFASASYIILYIYIIIIYIYIVLHYILLYIWSKASGPPALPRVWWWSTNATPLLWMHASVGGSVRCLPLRQGTMDRHFMPPPSCGAPVHRLAVQGTWMNE